MNTSIKLKLRMLNKYYPEQNQKYVTPTNKNQTNSTKQNQVKTKWK
jgi:hypothetical protein